jgi:ribonuclease VapC
MVLSDLGKEALRILEDWIVRPNVTLDPFDAPQYRDAVIAFERFGHGRHPAKLNFGDCMSHAVAKHHGVPLLYKGNDFRLTDIRSALP